MKIHEMVEMITSLVKRHGLTETQIHATLLDIMGADKLNKQAYKEANHYINAAFDACPVSILSRFKKERRENHIIQAKRLGIVSDNVIQGYFK